MDTHRGTRQVESRLRFGRRGWGFVLLGLLLAGAGLARIALALPGDTPGAQAASPLQPSYDLFWHVVAGGGGQSPGESYFLGSTAAEPGAGLSKEGGYALCAGFWCGPGAQQFRFYLPLAPRGHIP